MRLTYLGVTHKESGDESHAAVRQPKTCFDSPICKTLRAHARTFIPCLIMYAGVLPISAVALDVTGDKGDVILCVSLRVCVGGLRWS
jgi:hypothetical protein